MYGGPYVAEPLVPLSSETAVVTKSTGSVRDHCLTVLGGESGEEDEPDEADESDDDEPGSFYLSDDDEYDDLTMESLFLPVTSLWQVLGAIDDDERLTALGWWGLPEAMLRVWAPSGSTPD